MSRFKKERVGERLRHEREVRGWSQDELARRIDTERQNIHRWENNESFPQPFNQRKLAEVFGLSIEKLFLSQEDEIILTQNEQVSSPIDQMAPTVSYAEREKELEKPKHTTEAGMSVIRRDFMKQFKTRSGLVKITYIGAAGVIIAAVLSSVIGGVFLWRSRPSNQSPTTSTISHTIPCLVRCVLYHADWSQGLDGWMGNSQEWSVNSDGILVSNGNDQKKYFLIAPYEPKTPNYAVEAQIQFLKPMISAADPPLFGVRLRGGEYEDTNGYDFYIYKDTARIRAALDPDAQVLGKKSYHLNTSWHTYRFEANNHTLTGYIDNVQVLQVSDFNHTQPGSVGLYDMNSQINVRNFTVFSL